MRTVAWDTVSPIALRNYSKEVREEVSTYEILVKGEYMQWSTYSSKRFLLVSWTFPESRVTVITMKDSCVFLDIRRYKNQANKIGSWKYLSEDPCCQSHHTTPSKSASFLLSTLSFFQGVLNVSSWSSAWFNPCRDRWQVPIARANL